MKTIILIMLSTLLLACSNTDNQGDDSQLSAAQKQSGYECKNVKVTGTRISKKICNTAAERQYSKEHADEFARKMKDDITN